LDKCYCKLDPRQAFFDTFDSWWATKLNRCLAIFEEIQEVPAKGLIITVVHQLNYSGNGLTAINETEACPQRFVWEVVIVVYIALGPDISSSVRW
jgi:hypothetical protein